VNLLRTTRKEEIEPHLERFFAMHQARWLAKGSPGSFASPQKRAFYRDISVELLQRGWLRFYHLEVDGVIRASQFCFTFGSVLYSLQDAFDHDFHPNTIGALGVILRAMVIRECIGERLNGYDFLGGVEKFKTRWNTITHYVQRVRIGAPGSEGAAAFLLAVGVLKTKDWARERVPRWLLNTLRRVSNRSQSGHAPDAALEAQ
jgi:CelD/BcsL family acetyltransferase involved in cellulose biosynthesis